MEMICQEVGLVVIVAAIILGIILFDSWLDNKKCEHFYVERFKIENKDKDEAIISYRCCYCNKKINIRVKEGVNRLPQEGD